MTAAGGVAQFEQGALVASPTVADHLLDFGVILLDELDGHEFDYNQVNWEEICEGIYKDLTRKNYDAFFNLKR